MRKMNPLVFGKPAVFIASSLFLLSAFSLSPVTVTVASRSCDSAFAPRTKTREVVMLARVEQQRLLRRELIQFDKDTLDVDVDEKFGEANSGERISRKGCVLWKGGYDAVSDGDGDGDGDAQARRV
jgi:hypothetical protein